MKKSAFMLSAAMVAVLALGSCASKSTESDTAALAESAQAQPVTDTQIVVGDVVDMPSNPGDTTVVATGEAVAVEETAPAAQTGK